MDVCHTIRASDTDLGVINRQKLWKLMRSFGERKIVNEKGSRTNLWEKRNLKGRGEEQQS